MGCCHRTFPWSGLVQDLSRSPSERMVCRGPIRLMQYVELHARSAFSFLEGASVPEALAYACSEQQLPAMALLDRNGFYGSARFHLIARNNKIKSHVGAEISIGDKPSLENPYYPLLVANRTGYQNLSRLITRTKLREQKN